MKEAKEIQAIIKEAVRENIQNAVKEVLSEKVELLKELPQTKQVQEKAQELGSFSTETARLFVNFMQCFGIFIILFYALHQLIKEIKSPL